MADGPDFEHLTPDGLFQSDKFRVLAYFSLFFDAIFCGFGGVSSTRFRASPRRSAILCGQED